MSFFNKVFLASGRHHHLQSTCAHICWLWTDEEKKPLKGDQQQSSSGHMDQARYPARPFEVDVDLGFALFFLFLLCFFLLVTVVRCAQTVVDPYGSISTSTYQEEQITWVMGGVISNKTLQIHCPCCVNIYSRWCNLNAASIAYGSQANSEQKGGIITLSRKSQDMYQVVPDWMDLLSTLPRAQGIKRPDPQLLYNSWQQDLFCQRAQWKVATSLSWSCICQS